MLTCEKATLLITKENDSDANLSIGEKLSLNFHVMFCKYCKMFKIQNSSIDSAISKHRDENSLVLNDDQKSKMQENISKQMKVD